MLKRFLLFLFLFSLATRGLAVEQKKFRSSLGAGYIALFGDLKDYFKDGFAYYLGDECPLGTNRLGAYSLGTSLQWIPLKSDDGRESSKLRMLSLNSGINQALVNASWYSLVATLRPELSFWWVANNLSSSYARSDKGSLWGLTAGLINFFNVYPTWDLTLTALIHSPRISVSNVYFDVGFGIAKTW